MLFKLIRNFSTHSIWILGNYLDKNRTEFLKKKHVYIVS